LAFSYFESHFLTFNQSTTTSTVDSAEVNENVFAAFTLDETKTFILNITGHVRASTYYDPIISEPNNWVNR